MAETIPVGTMHNFTKEERLSSKRVIDRLFTNGRSFSLPPFQVTWESEPFGTALQARVLIGASRRKMRKAVDRNLMKRRMREAYRQNKKPFYDFLESKSKFCSFALIYASGRIAEYKEVEEKIILILERLQREYEKADQ